ncbi:MAG: hypothetical protein AB7N54_02770 [Alphaproteobacteria bacterium]
MQSLTIVVILAASFFANVMVETMSELTSDALLDDDPGVAAEAYMEPRNALVDMMPDATVIVWTGKRR